MLSLTQLSLLLVGLTGAFAVPAPAALSERNTEIEIILKGTNVNEGVCSDLCLRICYPHEPKCAEGWCPKKLGSCWTCCRIAPSSLTISETTPKPKKLEAPAQVLELVVSSSESSEKQLLDPYVADVCWMICYFEKPKCPKDWYAHKSGSCWTCCRGTDDLELSESRDKHSLENVHEQAPVCWAICYHMKPECPSGGYAKQFGECWTCCFGDEDQESSTSTDTSGKKLLEQVAKIQESELNSEAICWRACFSEKPECPSNAYAKRFGECWTCCFGDEESSIITGGEKLLENVAKIQNSEVHSQDACWKACFEEKPQCPTDWYAKQFGECWTCCIGTNDLEYSSTHSGAKKEKFTGFIHDMLL